MLKVLIIFLCVAAPKLYADEEKDSSNNRARPQKRLIKGRVLDQDGQGIKGADVWLPIQFDRIAHTTTKADGHYTIILPEAWVDQVRTRNLWDLWAHAHGHSIGVASAFTSLFFPDRETKVREPVDLIVGAETDTSFEVLDPLGKPLGNAVVRPFHFRTPTGFSIVPEELARHISARTDELGRAKLPAMPRKGFFNVDVESKQYGLQRRRLDYTGEGPARQPIRLRSVGRLEGRITAADDATLAQGVRLEIETSPRVGGVNDPHGIAKVTTDKSGKFIIPAIAAGEVRIYEAFNKELPFRLRLPQVELEAGEMTFADLTLERAVDVQGRIQLAGADQNMAGARIAIRYGRFHQGEDVISDKEGRFRARVLPGRVYQHVIVLPPAVDAMRPIRTPFHVPADVKEFRLPPIELLPVTHLLGHLVDTAGQPIPTARVYAITNNQLYGGEHTDDKGQFKLRVPHGLRFSGYRVIAGGVQTDATIVERDPLQIEISPVP